MKRQRITDHGNPMIEHRTIMTVSEVLKSYFATGQIPSETTTHPYDFADRDSFDGNLDRVLHPDLIQTVSRESRESAARKAQLSSSAASGIKSAEQTPAGEPGLPVDPSSSASPKSE